MSQVSPGLIAKCGLVVMEGNDFTWKTIFSNWFENAQEDESIMRLYQKKLYLSHNYKILYLQYKDILKLVRLIDILYYRWRRGQEELIEGLFFWLGTPLLKLVMETCRPVFTPIANGLIR